MYYSKKQILTKLFKAWFRFKKGKSNKKDVLLFENFLENEIYDLANEIYNNNYKHGGYEYFQVFDSKKRAIHKALVKDRIVHEFLRYELEHDFNKNFIRDSYASIKDKGSLKCVKKFQYYLSQTKYTVSLDVRKYFDNVDHLTLIKILEKRYKNNSTQYCLLKEVIDSFGNKKGIPLGNSVSQVFANIYLNDLDWFCLKDFNYYIRYNDDIRICCNEIYFVKMDKVINFVNSKLSLEIPKEKISTTKNTKGVDFLGYKVFSSYFKLNNKVKNKISSRITSKNHQSYLGYTKNGSNYDFSRKIKAKMI